MLLNACVQSKVISNSVFHTTWSIDRIRIGWNKFKQLVPLLTNRDMSLLRRGRLYSSLVRSNRKENEVALQQAEMRMVRWMYNKVKDRVPSKELRKRLGLEMWANAQPDGRPAEYR